MGFLMNSAAAQVVLLRHGDYENDVETLNLRSNNEHWRGRSIMAASFGSGGHDVRSWPKVDILSCTAHFRFRVRPPTIAFIMFFVIFLRFSPHPSCMNGVAICFAATDEAVHASAPRYTADKI
jgi:hypothetical protein